MIHPRAQRWRQLQSPYRVLGPAWVGIWILFGAITRPWRHVVLYSAMWVWIPAVFLFAAGIFIYICAGAHFSWTLLAGLPEISPGNHSQQLVTTGIHTRVRHPIYLAHLCGLLAWSVGTGLVVCWMLTVFAIVTGAVMIRMEDAELEKRFGRQYRIYRAEVPAIISSLMSSRSSFSNIAAAEAESGRIFVAFTGPKIEQKAPVCEIVSGYECWNLTKFGLDDFISTIQARVHPVNDTVLQRNYKRAPAESKEPFGLSSEQYGACSWGLLLPNSAPDAIADGYGEASFVLNLYSPHFLYPTFYVNSLGISCPDHRRSALLYYAHQNQADRFSREQFAVFYKEIISESGYAVWQAYRAARWTKEDWRVFVACLMFNGLTKYDAGKSPFIWQREAADTATILEALCTAGTDDNREVSYKLRKRVASLMSSRFPNIEQQIKDLYKQRSDFVHGSFFRAMAKKSKKSGEFAELPIPSFQSLYEQKEYVRYTLTAYLYLNKMRRSGAGEFTQFGSVLEILEASIIDVNLRAKVVGYADKVLSLM